MRTLTTGLAYALGPFYGVFHLAVGLLMLRQLPEIFLK